MNPYYGPIKYVEDDIKTGNYLEDVMHEARLYGSIFRPTIDNWYNNFPGDLVQININRRFERYRENKFAPSQWRIVEWRVFVQGEDALNSCWSFLSPDRDEVRQKYLSLPVIITKDDLRSRGFKHE